MLDDVRGHRFVSDSVLKTAVNSLRMALGEDVRTPAGVHTVARRGYRFCEAVLSEVAALGLIAAVVPSATVAAPPVGNLPMPAGPLLGREAAPLQLAQAMQAQRLVTLTGPGGVGKTQLALAAAAQQPVPADGVWLLRLDALAAAEGVASALARTLGFSDAAGARPQALAQAMVSLQLRRVLDNG